jgi:hypothetical protein
MLGIFDDRIHWRVGVQREGQPGELEMEVVVEATTDKRVGIKG